MYSTLMLLPDDDFSRVRTSTQGPEYALGQMACNLVGSRFKYVQAKDAVAYVVGHSVEWADTACTTVTNDRAGGSSLGRLPAGIAKGAPAQNGYFWIQTWGPCSGCATSGADDIAVGENVFPHATTDGTVDGSVATTATVDKIGYALDADDNSANTVTLFIQTW